MSSDTGPESRAAPATPALAVEELVAGYGGVIALDRVSISAGTAAITAVLGANGAGKTTLLRAVSGMIRPRHGRVLLDGTDLTGRSPEQMVRAGVVRAINTDLRHAMRAALEHAEDGQRARERAAFRAYFDMLSDRPWIDRIVRESEFIDQGLFREYYEHLVRGYARGVRAAQLAHEEDARYDPEVIAFAYTGIGNFVGMRWADWTAGGRVPDDVLDDVLELLARGLAPRDSALPRPEPTGVDNPVEGMLTMLCVPGETLSSAAVDG